MSDPYRALFDHLPAGIVRCRWTAGAPEILESNRAFDAFRDAWPLLAGVVQRAHGSRRTEQVRLHRERGSIAISAYPIDGDETIVVVEDTTASDALEQRSQDSEQRFEQAFHGNAAAMVIARQADLRILDVNPRWLELFGATRDEVIGRTTVELGLISEEDARNRIAEHARFSGGYDTELALRTRRGAGLTVLASARPITLPEGTCTLTTLIDITARKAAEEAFEVAFRASPAGMMLVHAGTDTVVAVNQRLLDMTRNTRGELVGRIVSELALVVQPSRAELLAQIAGTGRLDEVEVTLARVDGSFGWALASTETITLHGTSHRLTVFTDITTRKRVERRLFAQHAIGRVLAGTSDFAAAVPPVLEALCTSEGCDGGALWVVDGLRGAWGRAVGAGELVERIAQERGVAALADEVGFPILAGGDVVGAVVIGGRDAGEPDAMERGLYDSIGRMLGSFVERTRAETALRELNLELENRVRERTCELEAANRDLEAFTSTVSHDLGAPLRAINGFTQILLEDYAPDLPAGATELLQRIHEGGTRLRDLIHDLLAFSRFGRAEIRRTTIDLDAQVHSVVDELVASRGVGDRLDLRVDPLGTCEADPSLVRTVWVNLLDNALKYSRDRKRIVIDIGREERGGEVIFYVRDNGVGFDMARADRLFGVFQRLHSSTEFEGTGVGLASVHRIVERHRGRVSGTSELGRGSRFEFTLAPPR